MYKIHPASNKLDKGWPLFVQIFYGYDSSLLKIKNIDFWCFTMVPLKILTNCNYFECYLRQHLMPSLKNSQLY